jgi:hypothetical protein
MTDSNAFGKDVGSMKTDGGPKRVVHQVTQVADSSEPKIAVRSCAGSIRGGRRDINTMRVVLWQIATSALDGSRE